MADAPFVDVPQPLSVTAESRRTDQIGLRRISDTATINATDGPLSVSGPGDISKWMAVPWQTDTASCRAGYSQTEFPSDPFIPTFWPSRVPNNVLTEAQWEIISQGENSATTEAERMAAFNTRPYWLRSLDFSKPYVDQITKMVSSFWRSGADSEAGTQRAGDAAGGLCRDTAA